MKVQIVIVLLLLLSLAGAVFAQGFMSWNVIQVGAGAQDTTITFNRLTKAVSISISNSDLAIKVLPHDANAWTVRGNSFADAVVYFESPTLTSITIYRSTSQSAVVTVIEFLDW